MTGSTRALSTAWPPLPFEPWKDTAATLHRWTQVVGKVRLERSPWINHSWQVPLYVTARGLTTSPIPCGNRLLEIAFDFLSHRLVVQTSSGDERVVALEPRSVADFYGEVMDALGAVGCATEIYTVPSEIEDAVRFEDDTENASYDADAAERFWRVLVQSHRVFQRFRSGFRGKSSPVHFFWGSFDLAVTRFSGREAPPHPGGFPNLPDWVAREAYSHEVSSAGFWPGGSGADEAFYYSYAYPSPEGFRDAPVGPEAARWLDELGEFVLPYEAVRTAEDPDRTLLEFLDTTYAAAAQLADWDRAALEWTPPR